MKLKKKPKSVQIRTRTNIKTVMCLSKKTKTKQFDTTEKEEDWIEYIKRSTKEAEEHMKKMKYLAGLNSTED